MMARENGGISHCINFIMDNYRASVAWRAFDRVACVSTSRLQLLQACLKLIEGICSSVLKEN